MARGASLTNGTLLVLLGLLAALVVLARLRGGDPLLLEGLGNGVRLLLRYAPLVGVSFLAAGLAGVLIPSEWARETLGEESGLRGILIAAGAGVITPAGPYVAFPIAAVRVRSGAAAGPVVAFVTGWALLALHRFVAWEIPILGWRLAVLRYGVCLVLPVLAGLLARAVSRA